MAKASGSGADQGTSRGGEWWGAPGEGEEGVEAQQSSKELKVCFWAREFWRVSVLSQFISTTTPHTGQHNLHCQHSVRLDLECHLRSLEGPAPLALGVLWFTS